MRERFQYLELIGLIAPFILWALAFVTLYAVHGFACALGLADGGAGGVRSALSALLALFLTAHCFLAWWFWKRCRSGGPASLRFVRCTSCILAVGAASTTAWTGFPVLILSICT